MLMNSKEFREWCWNNSVRITQMIPLGFCHDGTECDGLLGDLIDDNSDEELGKILGLDTLAGYMKSLCDPDDEPNGSERREAILQFLVQKQRNGFLTLVERPVKRYLKKSKTATYSWGFRNTIWLYAKELDSAFTSAVIAWADARERKERRKAS
jgi:hypothetical protein